MLELACTDCSFVLIIVLDFVFLYGSRVCNKLEYNTRPQKVDQFYVSLIHNNIIINHYISRLKVEDIKKIELNKHISLVFFLPSF